MKSKIRKFLAFFMMAVIMVITMNVTANAESLFSQAKLAESGKKYSVNLLKDGNAKWMIYKVVLSKNSDLKIKFTFNISTPTIVLFDKNGNTIKPDTVLMTAGTDTHWDNSCFINDDGSETSYEYTTVFNWNEVTKKASGTLVYEYLTKGTYYITYSYKIDSIGSGKSTFTMTFPSKSESSAKISSLGQRMEVGDTIKLFVDAEPADAEIKWSSSNEKVATVSDSGKVTAKKAGTTIITAKCGNSSIKIKIIVE